jgi:hypothetical protein
MVTHCRESGCGAVCLTAPPLTAYAAMTPHLPTRAFRMPADTPGSGQPLACKLARQHARPDSSVTAQLPAWRRGLHALAMACCLALPVWHSTAQAQATFVQTPYEHPKALVDIYSGPPGQNGGCAVLAALAGQPADRSALQHAARGHERDRAAARHRAGDRGQEERGASTKTWCNACATT